MDRLRQAQAGRLVELPSIAALDEVGLGVRVAGQDVAPNGAVGHDRRPQVGEGHVRRLVDRRGLLTEEREIPAVARDEVRERGHDRAVGARRGGHQLLAGEGGADVDEPFRCPDVVGERIVEERGHRDAPACAVPAFVATSPMIAATSAGRDHIGQWLVGRSIQVMSWSSGIPARNDHSGCSFAYFW